MLTNDQVLAAHKANVETLLGLSRKGFETVEKLVDLNLQTAKAALEEAQDVTETALSAKDAQQFLAVQASLLQPSAEKAAAYGRKLYDIAAAANAEVGKVAEAGAADAQKKLLALVDAAVKNAPAGSENAATLLKAAVSAANNAFESVQKAAKQATDVAEANFTTLSSQVAKSTPAKGKRAA